MKKIFLVTIVGCLITASLQAQSAADSLLNFIVKNKEKASLYMLKNDYEFAKLNEDRLMPLAATSNLIVAVEFAKQAAYNVFGFNALVPLKDIKKYYLPNTDGGAFSNWVKFETRLGHIKADSVKLIDVARGMIMYGSAANAEYLMELLGFGNLKNDIRMFGLKQHTLLYPMPSSIFLYQNPKKLPEDKVLKEIQSLKDDDYYKAIFSIHRELNNDSGYKEKFRPQDLSIKMQKAWSDRLTASTAKEYAKVVRLINSRMILNERSYSVLGRLLESIMESPTSRAWLKHAGMIGGSTISVFTRVIYATLKDGTKIELAYFFNDLNARDNFRLQSWSLDFDSRILKDESFRKKVAEAISGKKK
jgi:D-alanyl-D-alanine carboxypeptidase